jgi:micrococcal nuclease
VPTRSLRVLIALIIGFALAGCSSQSILVSDVYDGDTFSTSNGLDVRLLQIDTPELSGKECYSEEARVDLTAITEKFMSDYEKQATGPKTLTKKRTIKLEQDPALDSKDTYGRTLAYLILGNQNINIELVRRGSAVPYFYGGNKGKYSVELEKAADFARDNRLGIWGNCPGFIYNPYKAANTGSSSGLLQASQEDFNGRVYKDGDGNCSPHYRECVPPYPPDYDCGDLKPLGLIHVLDSDPHRLDRDGDGLACESNAR